MEVHKHEALAAETRLQQFVEVYEVSELEATLLEQADEAVSVLVACNDELERLKQGATMTVRRKHVFLKFSWKLATIRRILCHNLVANRIKEYDVMKVVEELEVEFLSCLSAQLVVCISQGATLRQTE